MKENDWIEVSNFLPGIGKEVKVKTKNGKECTGKLIYGTNWIGVHFSKTDNSNIPIFEDITHWRPIPEKRPDFSRLKNGDLVYISHKDSGYDQVGFYCGQSDGSIILCRFKDLDCLQYRYEACDKIKKITRINFEKKTFEEI